MLPLLLAILLQDPDLDDLVRRLGDPSAEERRRATDHLEMKGPAVVPRLQDAMEDADPEVRTRARDILVRLEPTLFLDSVLKAQRPIQVWEPHAHHRTWGTTAVLEGGWFTFSRLWWMEQWKVLGTVINTSWHPSMNGSVRWEIVGVTNGCEVPFTRCPTHSPGLIFIDGECSDPVSIRIRGVRRWCAEVPVTFRFPKAGDLRRVGPYTVTLAWPWLEIAGRDDAPGLAASDYPSPNDLTCVLRPGSEFEHQPSDWDDDTVPIRPSAEEAPRGTLWCGCSRTPSTPPAAADPRGLRRLRLSAGLWKRAPLGILSEITLKFRYPVEEPFEVTSDPLK